MSNCYRGCLTRPALRGRSWVLAALALLLTCPPASADDPWDVSPYVVRIWVSLEPVPELSAAWSARLPSQLQCTFAATLGAACQAAIEIVPASRTAPLLEASDTAVVESLDPSIWDADKLIVVSVSTAMAETAVTVRELDGRTRLWTERVTLFEPQPERLGRTVGSAILSVFTPVGLLGRQRNNVVDVRMRAGLLVNSPDSPLLPAAGDVMRAVLRKNDRLGRPVPDGILPLEWTVLRVDEVTRGVAACTVLSGLRSPLRTRSSRQVEKLALRVTPRYPGTTIRLRSNDHPPRPLDGFRVYSRLPGHKATSFVGLTDYRGEIRLTRDGDILRILYVKNGDRLLARLPVIVGFRPLEVAEILDDSLRLEAEGFLKGVQERMVDLVVRRRILAARVRQRLDDDKLDEAERLLDELRNLETREDLLRQMRDRQQQLSSTNRAVQDRIDRLFRDSRMMVQRYLDSGEIDQLRRELLTARQGAGTSGASGG